MLIIREKQMSVFQQFLTEKLVQRMVRYVEAEFPARYAEMGEAGTRDFIRRSMEAGATHNLFLEGAIAVYIELRLAFGEDFELAPDRVWAHKLLAHPSLPDYVKVDTIRQKFETRTQGRTLVRHQAGQSAEA